MAERGKGFPRISLSSAIQIIDSASKFGKEWNRETFATYGAKNNAGSAKSGAFLSRLSALKEYGLITADKSKVGLTELGAQITKPISETERSEAIKKAFLLVGTFSDLFNSLESEEDLPKERVVEYAVHNLGISRDSKDRFISCFIDSGKYVGLVVYNKDAETIRLSKLTSNNLEETRAQSEISIGSSESNAQKALPNLVGMPEGIDSNPLNAALNEQGVNHSGEGWGLTVLIKSSHRLPAELRKSIRDLLEGADNVADQFYDLEKKEQ